MKKLLYSILISLCISVNVYGEGSIIQSITVEGNQNINTQDILDFIPLKVGKKYTAEREKLAQTYLDQWGIFKSVIFEKNPSLQGMAITIRLEEATMVTDILL